MNGRAMFSKLLLIGHLIVCLVWLYLFRTESRPPIWMIHVFLWSIIGVQFTWGFTVGYSVGPSRRRRGLLWWSLLTIFMPLYFIGPLVSIIHQTMGLGVALVYFGLFVAILASETFGGVMLGAKLHGCCSVDED